MLKTPARCGRKKRADRSENQFPDPGNRDQPYTSAVCSVCGRNICPSQPTAKSDLLQLHRNAGTAGPPADGQFQHQKTGSPRQCQDDEFSPQKVPILGVAVHPPLSLAAAKKPIN